MSVESFSNNQEEIEVSEESIVFNVDGVVVRAERTESEGVMFVVKEGLSREIDGECEDLIMGAVDDIPGISFIDDDDYYGSFGDCQHIRVDDVEIKLSPNGEQFISGASLQAIENVLKKVTFHFITAGDV